MNDIILDTEKPPVPFDESYFDTHTYGIEDKYYTACGLECELPLWKSMEKKGKRLSFNKKAFLDPGRFFLGRCISSWGAAYYFLLMAVLAVCCFFSVEYTAVTAPDIPEEPRYSYAEARRMQQSLIDDVIGDCPLYILLRKDMELVPELEAVRRKLNKVMESDEYKQLTEYMEQAREYETAAANAEKQKEFKLKTLPYLLYISFLFAINLVVSLFADHIYSRWARKQIICILADYETGEMSEWRFKALAEAHFTKQMRKASEVNDTFN